LILKSNRTELQLLWTSPELVERAETQTSSKPMSAVNWLRGRLS